MTQLDKNAATNAGDKRDMGLILESERSPGGGHGNPLQYYWLKNPMERRAWQATVYRVAQSQTGLRRFSRHTWYSAWILLKYTVTKSYSFHSFIYDLFHITSIHPHCCIAFLGTNLPYSDLSNLELGSVYLTPKVSLEMDIPFICIFSWVLLWYR